MSKLGDPSESQEVAVGGSLDSLVSQDLRLRPIEGDLSVVDPASVHDLASASSEDGHQRGFLGLGAVPASSPLLSDGSPVSSLSGASLSNELAESSAMSNMAPRLTTASRST